MMAIGTHIAMIPEQTLVDHSDPIMIVILIILIPYLDVYKYAIIVFGTATLSCIIINVKGQMVEGHS